MRMSICDCDWDAIKIFEIVCILTFSSLTNKSASMQREPGITNYYSFFSNHIIACWGRADVWLFSILQIEFYWVSKWSVYPRVDCTHLTGLESNHLSQWGLSIWVSDQSDAGIRSSSPEWWWRRWRRDRSEAISRRPCHYSQLFPCQCRD